MAIEIYCIFHAFRLFGHKIHLHRKLVMRHHEPVPRVEAVRPPAHAVAGDFEATTAPVPRQQHYRVDKLRAHRPAPAVVIHDELHDFRHQIDDIGVEEVFQECLPERLPGELLRFLQPSDEVVDAFGVVLARAPFASDNSRHRSIDSSAPQSSSRRSRP